ncbi:MAG: adenylosuccinate synthetase, partial [Acidobacteria bacterium]|nr:adenylosuccinate synthetase [Acidobacteriota bacterium]
RCGWLDLVAARYAQRVNGISAIALTKLDVLDDLDEIKVCVGYRQGGMVHRDYSALFEGDEPFEPVYATLPGWKQSTVGLKDFADLPRPARDYLEMIEDEVGAPLAMVSTGPRREETILRPGLEPLLAGGIDAVAAQLVGS